MEQILISMLNSVLAGPTHERNTPLEYQLPFLGLDVKTIKRLKGKRTLDIACGIGELVKYLRSQGVEAEGIDPRAPEDQWFTKRMLVGVGQARGISAPDNTYDLITSFQCLPLNQVFRTDLWQQYEFISRTDPGVEKTYTTESEEAFMVLSEISRTLRKGGRAVIFPHMQRLIDDNNGYLLRMFGFSKKEETLTARELSRYPLPNETRETLQENIESYPSFAVRTVLVKN